ncbi:T9SS type A sorting domain-containing protein [Phaeocystidibacter luteus]|uniref:T9SS type A sorting domain-containing protein n=1 Tax=Phaeocystidibacter luteus TaxID=911197 RepID=A0A6N6RHZ5_9FLAO|nr:T9SS type A sorting domain-containing protein [Phaeocystidibacter luteus]KAB2813942.1 T9SS type A sorting domain-containing protein [Phaeocystidibacter luteus]
MKTKYILLFLLALAAAAVSAQWTSTGISATLNNPTIEAIEGVEYHNGKLYANTFLRGHLVSNDLGTTWDSLHESGLNHYVTDMISYGGELHAFCHINGLVAGMYYRSSDDGLNWTLDTAGMPGSAITAGYPANFIDIAFVGDYMLAQMGTPLKPYYRKHIDSTDWHSLSIFDNQGCPRWYVKNDTAWTYNIFNVYYSIDYGKTWTTTPHNIPSFAPGFMHKEGNTIYLAGGGGFGNPDKLMRSTDNGATWTQLTALSDSLGMSWLNQPSSVNAMYVDGQEMYISATNNATNDPPNIWYSADAGASWSTDTLGLALDPYGTTTIVEFFEAGGYLFAWSNFFDVYRKGQSVSVIESDVSDIQVYPNPASDRIIIQSETEILSASLIDMNGRSYHLHLEGTGVIDIAQYPTGLYCLQLQTESGTQTTKLVVQ